MHVASLRHVHLGFNGDTMNGKSDCCAAPTVKDSTGDVICTACGLIIDNYKKEDEQGD